MGNQNDYPMNPSGQYLASYAQDIKDSCTYNMGGNSLGTGGEEYDTGKSLVQESPLCQQR